MHVGILGSYFNPPHLGHLFVTRQVIDLGGFDKAWFLPGLKSTFNKELIPVKHRLNMIKLVNMPGTQVSTLEIDHQLDGNTINLVPLLKKYHPQDSFTFIIGSDQLPTFHKWGEWERLLQALPFLVFPRAGFPMEPIYKGMQPFEHELLIKTNISSTIIRERCRQGLSINQFVPRAVAEYVSQHKLYL